MYLLEWQKARSAFNHDWLKNRYIPFLSKGINVLLDRIEDKDFEINFFPVLVSQWESHQNKAETLIKEFEHLMSPKILFDHGPLKNCDRETKRWLSHLVHEIWIGKNPVKLWIENASKSLFQTQQVYEQLSLTLSEAKDTTDLAFLSSMHGEVADFRLACIELAKAIEKFPSSINF